MAEEKQTMTQRAAGVAPNRAESPEELKLMVQALEEIQLSLEPVRDQALDRKAFFTGYAQCAEEMIKAIVAKMGFLKTQATQKKEYISTMEKEAEEAEKRKRKEVKTASKSNGKSRRRAPSEDSPT